MNKLKILTLTVCIVSLWAEIQGSEDYDNPSNTSSSYNTIDVINLAELRGQQSAEIESNSKKKEKLDELGSEGRRTDNFVGRGYTSRPPQRAILEKNKETK